ncbi:hypothetical protein A4G26_22225 [Mycobacterium kansasii]|uniref:Uncharacterized protein n=1 Tax=Mycobacterium innocens TaxID=2341083 RepID=A0A498QEN8_9MYCO|nr:MULTISPECIES: hypothetical protein [Mycobacterium]KZS75907.1 hypothetical protein A4G26_22225 [Mycobacterium kansasii]VBA43062.1 hypothetical protein LAUMK13_04343 [Mycobacterium innocens]
MPARITYTATAPNGETFPRTSATMRYTHALLCADDGADNWGAWSWHKTGAAADKAANNGVVRNSQRKVVPVEVTKVAGKIDPADTFALDAKARLDAAKAAPVAEAAPEPVAAGPMTSEQKQALGTLVHAAARQALADLPAGVDPAEAAAQIDKWLSYIPQAKAS